MASMLLTLQGANWQRGGGRGEKPKRIERPKDTPAAAVSASELAARKEKLKREKQRRAQAK